MTQQHYKQRQLKIRKSTFLWRARLAPFLIAVLLYGYNSIHGADKVKTSLGVYAACGKFGDHHMIIDKSYLHFARVTYQGVNYWGKSIRAEHAAKGCDDQIQSIALKVQWPEMKATQEGFRLHSKNKNEMTIALNQRSVWKDELGSTSFFNDIGTLNRKLRNNFDGVEVTEEWRNLTKKWDSELKLFVIDVVEGQNSTRKIYWQEAQENEIRLVIDCTYFWNGISSCNLATHESEYGFNTSYISISFHSELLPHWQDLLQDSKTLINSFNVTEKKS